MFSCQVLSTLIAFAASSTANFCWKAKAVRLVTMIFMPLSQFVAVWLIRKVHSVVLRAVTLLSTHSVNITGEVLLYSSCKIKVCLNFVVQISMHNNPNFHCF